MIDEANANDILHSLMLRLRVIEQRIGKDDGKDISINTRVIQLKNKTNVLISDSGLDTFIEKRKMWMHFMENDLLIWCVQDGDFVDYMLSEKSITKEAIPLSLKIDSIIEREKDITQLSEYARQLEELSGYFNRNHLQGIYCDRENTLSRLLKSLYDNSLDLKQYKERLIYIKNTQQQQSEVLQTMMERLVRILAIYQEFVRWRWHQW
jgi:hypothetical protein